MQMVNINVAKAKLSALIEQVRKGESVILCRYGRPVAELVPLGSRERARPNRDLACVLYEDPTSPTADEWAHA